MNISKLTIAVLGGAVAGMVFLLGIAVRPALLHSVAGLSILSLAAIGAGVVELLLVRVLLLAPLSDFSKTLNLLREEKDYATRLVPRASHLAALAGEVNSLIETLELTQTGRQQCQSRLRALFDRSQLGVASTGRDGAFMEYNATVASCLGHTPTELPDLKTLIHRWCMIPEQREAMEEMLADMRDGREVTRPRLLTVGQRDGTSRDVLVYAAPVEEQEGNPYRYLLHFVDVTALRAAEEDLRLLRCAVDAMPLGLTITDASGRVQYTNPAEAAIHGLKASELIGREARTMAPRDLWKDIPLDQIARDTTPKRESLNVRAGGEVFPVRLIKGVIRDASQRPLGLVSSCEDISEQKHAEHLARESSEQYIELVESCTEIMCTHDVEGVLLDANRAAVAMAGRRNPDELIGRKLDEFLPRLARRRLQAYLDALRQHGRADGLTRLVAPDETSRVLRFESIRRTATPETFRLFARDVTEYRRAERMLKAERHGLRTKVGALSREMRGLNERFSEELTRRRRLEAALRDSEKRFRMLFEDAPVGIYRTTRDGRVVMANPTLISMLGCSSFEELAAVDLAKIGFGPASRDGAYARLMETEGEVREMETVWARSDGSSIAVRDNARAVLGADKEVLCYQGIVEDITHRKSLEDQLRQSLKMEALGRLAGGVAHDFNNILTGIIGYSDLSLMRLREGEPVRRNVGEIKRAAERATNLTRQLLAFSRRQILQPKVLDINSIVTDMERMLKRLMGEDVLLVTKLDPTVGLIEADPGQVEQVILNLAVNARDAMPGGGTVSIATCNIQVAVDCPPEVKLAVSDTGCGITPEVKAHLFEPFFTTKQKGTGLGLSTVYGIVSQSKGSIQVLSEVGMGTTIEVCLPMVEKGRTVEVQPAGEPATAHGREVVLVVEDDDVVRQVAREALELSGFTVLLAPHGAQAMATCETHRGPIHIVVTDVVMPGIDGPELAKRVASLRPGTRVLFVSGYTDDQITHHGVLAEGIAFLQKPFTPEALVRKVREVLDAPAKA
ncbi:MAG: PAS domain S-box protein [Acidobacteriota bacterium]